MGHDFKNYPELTNAQFDLYYLDSPHKQITEDFDAVVEKVSDGDTIRVSCDFRDFNFPIRLIEIAAPEMNEDGGKEAQKFLEDMLEGEEVTIQIDKKNRVEKWGRLLGRVLHRGVDVGQEIMINGHAIKFDDLQKDKQEVFL
jgi:endonuclease YncB( thermonuclease family)